MSVSERALVINEVNDDRVGDKERSEKSSAISRYPSEVVVPTLTDNDTQLNLCLER